MNHYGPQGLVILPTWGYLEEQGEKQCQQRFENMIWNWCRKHNETTVNVELKVGTLLPFSCWLPMSHRPKALSLTRYKYEAYPKTLVGSQTRIYSRQSFILTALTAGVAMAQNQ